MPRLGNTGLDVSKLCYGTLALSDLQGAKQNNQQSEKDVKSKVALLKYALSKGINFFDTAELYDNYALLRQAFKGYTGEIVIATKSYAYSRTQMIQSLERARKELDRDVIEIFLLHEQESMYTLRGHAEALDYLCEAKEKGIVKAVGLSTHAVAGVRAGAAMPQIDVIHPIVNSQGLGIIDGNIQDMLQALELAAQMGKGIYAMKALGGGHLGTEAIAALSFVNQLESVGSIAVGMASELEIDVNLKIIKGLKVPEEMLDRVAAVPRKLQIAPWCEGCGKCVTRCQQEALVLLDNKLEIRREKCVLCGYCSRACPHFCLKIVSEGVSALYG